jgi:hypothetical protein
MPEGILEGVGPADGADDVGRHADGHWGLGID